MPTARGEVKGFMGERESSFERVERERRKTGRGQRVWGVAYGGRGRGRHVVRSFNLSGEEGRS